jgi:hypothetical protein
MGCFIRKQKYQQQNPKQQDSKSYDRYDVYKSAKNLHEFLDAGGSLGDFRHDLKKGFLCLVGNAAAVLSDAATVTRSIYFPAHLMIGRDWSS